MDGPWLVSYILLWGLVFFLGFAVLVLARQIGVLHSRLPSYGARTTSVGPAVGDQFDPVSASDLQGRPVFIGTPPGRIATLLVFSAVSCSACAEIAPALRSLARSDRGSVNLVIVGMDGDADANAAYARQRHLDQLQYVVDPGLGARVGVTATPYALLLDRENEVRAKGIVNNLEQLESLLSTLGAEVAIA